MKHPRIHRPGFILFVPFLILYMMKNKILILLMSCNQPLYQREEQACRETFLKAAEGAGIPYWFYRGGSELVVDPDSRVMTLPVPDDLAGTARKTVAALTEALKDGSWDYLVKTNVSTWLDVEKIQAAVDMWEGRDDTNIYGARFLANEASMHVPFPRGHFTVMSRSLVEGVVSYSPRLIATGKCPRTDDTLICLSAMYFIEKALGKRYLESLKEVPSVTAWAEDIVDAPDWTDALSVRCKDEPDRENTPDNMRKVQTLKSSGESGDRRRPMGVIETNYGPMTYDRYCKVLRLLDEKDVK